MQYYICVYTQRSGYWGEGIQVKPENSYRLHKRTEREIEIMTTETVRGHSKNGEIKISFCHLLGNSGTTTLYRFRLLSRARSTIYYLIQVQ